MHRKISSCARSTSVSSKNYIGARGPTGPIKLAY
jgi:hypothetical protein